MLAKIKDRSSVLLFLLPVIFLFVVYWNGLRNWFEQDDFAWLGLHTQVTDWPSFLNAMFAPMAQGTIRPWSERGFFLLFYKLFESNAVPYHIAVFVTQAANLVLLALVMLKLTGSRVAAVAAPVLWVANTTLLTPLCWVSDYNQIQCAFFLLLAFLLYLHDRYWLQFAVFVLGFGALELNIVYPALLLAYVVCCQYSRAQVLRTLPLFAVSVAYYFVHFAVAPRQTAGVYAMHLDSAIVSTLGTYWTMAFAPTHSPYPVLATILFSVLIPVFVFWQLVQGRRLPLFFLLWFFIALAPTLPLRDHVSDYYLAIPVLGIGAVLALALAEHKSSIRTPAVALTVIYFAIQVPIDRFGTRWYLGHTRAVRSLVWGVRQARTLHPGKTILLTDVSDDLYLDSIAHSVFRTLDIPDVYLAPELMDRVRRLSPEDPDAPAYVLPAGAVIHALEKENLQVYSAASDRLRNVTSLYERTAGQRFGWDEQKNIPQRVDAGSPFLAYLLGSTWYPPDGNFRWMPSRASFRIGGSRIANAKLTLSGYCPPEQTEFGPLTLSVSVEGHLLAEARIFKPETSFLRTFVLPPALAGRDSVEVTLAVNRTVQKPPGSPPLGLAFGIFEIR